MLSADDLKQLEQNKAIAKAWESLEEWQKWEPITENAYFDYVIALIIKALLTNQDYSKEVWLLILEGVKEHFETDIDALRTKEGIRKWIKKQNIPL